MWPLSCCWYTEWTQLSDTSKYCSYSENGRHKERAVRVVPDPANTGVSFRHILCHTTENYPLVRHRFVEWTESCISELNKVVGSGRREGWPCFVPCQWSECKGTKLNRAVLLKAVLNCKMIVFWRDLWDNEGVRRRNDQLSVSQISRVK